MSWLTKNAKLSWAFLAGLGLAIGGWMFLQARKVRPMKTRTEIKIKHRKDPKDEGEANNITNNIDSLYD